MIILFLRFIFIAAILFLIACTPSIPLKGSPDSQSASYKVNDPDALYFSKKQLLSDLKDLKDVEDFCVCIKSYVPAPVLKVSGSTNYSTSQLTVSWQRQFISVGTPAFVLQDKVCIENAISFLDSWAEGGALLRTSSDKGGSWKYGASAASPFLNVSVAAETASVAIVNYWLVRDHLVKDKVRHDRIFSWLSAVKKRYVDDWANFQLQWVTDPFLVGLYGFVNCTATQVMWAILTQDDSSFDRSVGRMLQWFGRVRDNGVIYPNTYRGDRAIFYHAMGINALIGGMELLDAQGYDVWSVYGKKAHAAVKFLMDSLDDPSVIMPYARRGHNNPGRGKNLSAHLPYYHHWNSWAYMYLKRFPNHENSDRVKKYIERMPIYNYDIRSGIDFFCAYGPFITDQAK